MREGLIIITGGDSALRLCPPLVISEAEVAWGLRVLDRLIPQVFPSVKAAADAPALPHVPELSLRGRASVPS
jgi:hypothetical protein